VENRDANCIGPRLCKKPQRWAASVVADIKRKVPFGSAQGRLSTPQIIALR
jgi:hypothetical protein